MTVSIPPGTKPGQWRQLRINGDLVVKLRCGGCGAVGYLDDHKIEGDGTVTPEIVCPANECGWHVTGRLEGWNVTTADPTMVEPK
jgi:hypothetical protein